MRKTIYLIFLFSILLVLSGCGRFVTVYYKVIDDEGVPVSAAEMSAGYSTGGGWTNTSVKGHTKKGRSDKSGLFVYKAWMLNSLEDITAKIEKNGYYTTFAPPVKFGDVKRGRWNDINHPLIITLKKIKNPVPMYHKQAKPKLPSNHGSFGYDLIEGDLVRPYGTGKVNDFIFHVSPTIDKYGNKTVLFNITFSNNEDGIQPLFVQSVDAQAFIQTTAKFDYNAPSTGYFNTLNNADRGWIEKYNQPEYRNKARNWQSEVNYYFKIRSQSNRSAMYGWVAGFFRVSVYADNRMPHIEFEYALNPAGTRNVEFLRNLPMKIIKEYNEYLH